MRGWILPALVVVLACGDDDEAVDQPPGAARITELEARVARLEARLGEVETRPAQIALPTPSLTNGEAADPGPLAPDPAAPLDRPLAHAAPAVPAAPPAGPAEQVSLFIRTPGIRAEVLDSSGAVLGETNRRGGVEIARSDTAVKLVLRASGYQDLQLSLVPNRDKMVVKELRSN
jgi:hypothetical protein